MVVSLQKASSYDENLVYQKIKNIFEDLGGVDKYIKPKSKVLLKVNLITDTPPEVAATTHPSVVAALIRIVKEAGGICWVGDSSGGSCYGLTSKSYINSGIAEVTEKLGAEWKNFDSCGVQEIIDDDNVFFKKFYIAQPVVEADVVISVAKLKNHTLTLYSGAIKNILGVIPGSGKKVIHQVSPKPNEFSQSLLDLYKVVKPTIGIIDGIIGQDGDGPVQGTPFKSDLLLGSNDCLALDAVALELIGYDSKKHPLITSGIKRNLGIGELEQINLKGEKFEDCKCLGWNKVFNQHIIDADEDLVRKSIMGPSFKVLPQIKSNCIGCRLCVDSCPVEAITIQNKVAVIDYDKCIECYCCHELCRHKAVELNKSEAVHTLYGKVRKHTENIKNSNINILKE